MPALDAFYLTSLADHIVVALIGLAIAWMGYRLFRSMPPRREGEAKIGLPGGISIYFSRVGPGAFFVLFGTGLIGYTAAVRPFSYQQDAMGVKASGFADQSAPSTPSPAPPPDAAMPSRPGVVRALAALAAENDAAPLSQAQIERANALRVARAQVMLAGWDPAWGDRAVFRRWVDNAMPDPPPAAAARAVAVFRGQ